jgi:hypothetical protein
MTFPAVTAPYGLQPINRIDGMPYAGAIRQIPVAAGFGTAIFNGDTVVINSDGVLVKSTTTDSGNIVGVCVGGQYVNSSGQTVQGQFIPALASTSTNLALAYVVDDPMALFKVAVVTSGTTMGTAGRTVVGSNLPLVLNAGNTTTDSGNIVGVCLGGQYVNSSGQTIQGQFIPALASTSTNLALAYVVDDPMALFKVAVVTSGTTMGTAGRTVVGSNLPLVLNAGSTTTGNSAFAVTLTGAGTTATIPIRVIDVVPETATAADTYTELLVKINTHQYNDTTGV